MVLFNVFILSLQTSALNKTVLKISKNSLLHGTILGILGRSAGPYILFPPSLYTWKSTIRNAYLPFWQIRPSRVLRDTLIYSPLATLCHGWVSQIAFQGDNWLSNGWEWNSTQVIFDERKISLCHRLYQCVVWVIIRDQQESPGAKTRWAKDAEKVERKRRFPTQLFIDNLWCK